MRARLWSMTDVAKETGASRQTVWWRMMHGHIPAAEYETRSGTPYWSELVARRIVATWVRDLRNPNG